MTTYVCAEVVENICTTWAVSQTWLDALAITTEQAEQIAVSMVSAMLAAFIIGEIGHMIKVNVEKRF